MDIPTEALNCRRSKCKYSEPIKRTRRRRYIEMATHGDCHISSWPTRAVPCSVSLTLEVCGCLDGCAVISSFIQPPIFQMLMSSLKI